MRKQTARPLLVIVSILFCIGSLPAQQAKLHKAALFMEAFRYEEAIAVFDKIVRKDESNLIALAGLAEAYHKMDMLSESASWYAKALESTEADPFLYFAYGQVLFQMGECVAAQSAFQEFLRRRPNDQRANRLQDVCSYYQELTNSNLEQVEVSLPNFNGPLSDLAPAFFQDGIVFGAVRSTEKRKDAFYDLYFTRPLAEDRPQGLNLTYEPVIGFSEILNSGLNEAIVSFSPDFKAVYFTRNQGQIVSEKIPIRRLEIMVSRQGADNTWSSPVPLSINSVNYSTAHPALSPDGDRLFFASDRPGGFGGKDIYYCDRIGLGWSSPINLGPQVNTEGDELYPYYHTDEVLYFASNGQLGLGGLDIFRVEDLGGGEWGEPDNPGAPINSSADDFALIMKEDGSYGFFTSNRKNGVGSDDIYAFQSRKILLELQFLSESDSLVHESIPFALRGEEYMQFSDEDGRWVTYLEPEDCLYVQLQDENYQKDHREICASLAEGAQKISISWKLTPRSTAALPVFGEGEKVLTGKIIDQLDGAPVPFAEVRLVSTDCSVNINLTADGNGNFFFNTKEDCCYQLSALGDGYFTNTFGTPFCSKNWPEAIEVTLLPYRLRADRPQEVSVSNNEQNEFQFGSSVYEDNNSSIPYLLNVYYDLGRASVRPEAISELNRLYWLLVNNPTIVVEVASHTDAQGTASFNQRLSQRRANAIVAFLHEKGIARDRLIAKGYGESRLVNECKDGVECSEEAHQMNRRTEFRVLEQEIGQSN
ncbi:OmpA family protein [Lewinella sp. LCG006]|uniref:OmpA family protein n=1 Tax=Lewinella sp. LCG006 TaxID=3231911 RepID=UPI0034610EB8